MSSDNEEKNSVDSEYKNIKNNKKLIDLQYKAASTGLVYGYDDEDEKKIQGQNDDDNDIIDGLILHHEHYNEYESCDQNIEFTVSENNIDISGNAVDISGNAVDISGNALDTSVTTITTKPSHKQKNDVKLTVD